MLKTNSFHVVGTLIDVVSKKGSFKANGHNYINATATIKSVINGQDNIYKVRFFSSDVKADGTPNKLYSVYEGLEGNYKGHRVEIDGTIRDNRFVGKDGQMHAGQTLEGKWISAASESKMDEGTWTIGGFVARDIEEKTNKNNEVYRYDFAIGQANYKEDNMSLFTLHIAPGDNVILNGVRKYKVGDTVTLNGRLNFIETTAVVEDKNNAFGEPVTKTFINHNNNFFITSGSNPITDSSDPDKYNNQVIGTLVAAYKASGVEIQQKAASNANSAAAVETNEASKPSVRQTSLI
jgi:hypothetical protein